MSNWRDLNEQISLCRTLPDPIEALERLFQSSQDGHVAMALGRDCEAAGRRDEAARWYRTAEGLYPKAEFKAQARRALAALGARDATADIHADPAPEDVLYVVECSKAKAWALRGDLPSFVPAKDAYQGESIRRWRMDTRSSTARWLVLSARYGFIDPEQPVETRVCNHPVSARLADQKLARINKVVSGWPYGSYTVPAPRTLWAWLATQLGQPPQAKTVVMAMKMVDLLELARHGAHADLGDNVPLPVDLRIARLSVASGVVAVPEGQSLETLLRDAGELASQQRDTLVEAWQAIAERAGGLSAMRIDSLAWQLAAVLGDRAQSASIARTLIAERLESAGCPAADADVVAREFTQALT